MRNWVWMLFWYATTKNLTSWNCTYIRCHEYMESFRVPIFHHERTRANSGRKFKSIIIVWIYEILTIKIYNWYRSLIYLHFNSIIEAPHTHLLIEPFNQFPPNSVDMNLSRTFYYVFNFLLYFLSYKVKSVKMNLS